METDEVKTELDQLFERLGPADEARMIHADQSFAYVWTLDEKGDGIGLVRSATASGLLGQVDALLQVRYSGHSLRKLVVAQRMCGNRRFHERPDLLEIEQAINDRWCRWVAVTEFDRISRSVEAGELFLAYLRETETELVVTSFAPDKPFKHENASLDLYKLRASAEAERLRRAAIGRILARPVPPRAQRGR